MSLLLRVLAAPSPPGNGPSGGANWLSGYFPRVGYRPSAARRKARRNEFFAIF